MNISVSSHPSEHTCLCLTLSFADA
jgi:hypothetical protein